MAERPPLLLEFDTGGCPDCGVRRVRMPTEPVPLGDGFDWSARDFEGFRRMMLERLAAENPDRQRWTQADLEVTLIELLAASLDRMSHALDVTFAERFLATARWPRSVVRLLAMIDGVGPALAVIRRLLSPEERHRFGLNDPAQPPATILVRILQAHPQLIDTAKAAGIADVNRIESLISIEDVRSSLEAVPLFAQVHVQARVQGGITWFDSAILMRDSTLRLHDRLGELGPARRDILEWFRMTTARHLPPLGLGFATGAHLALQDDDAMRRTTIRTAVMMALGPLLPVSTRLRLTDGRRIGVFLRLCLEVAPGFFRSEVEMAARARLSARPGGLFDQSRLGFGQSIHVSDIQEAMMALPGVAGVIINALHLAGRPDTEATATGSLTPPSGRALSLDPDNPGPETGYYLLKLSGGLIG